MADSNSIAEYVTYSNPTNPRHSNITFAHRWNGRIDFLDSKERPVGESMHPDDASEVLDDMTAAGYVRVSSRVGVPFDDVTF
jgi:hypothetical protein